MINKKIKIAAIYIGLIFVCIIFAGPVLWVLSLSLKSMSDVLAYPPKVFPEKLMWENYIEVFNKGDMVTWILNSLKIMILSITGCLFISVPAAYSFSRFHFKGKQKGLIGVLVFQMISPLIIVIPLYRYFDSLNLLDSHIGLILVYMATQVPFTVWLLKGFFDSVPISIDEAAMIDGCSRIQAVLKVILPIAVPGVAAAMVFNAISAWSQFIIPLILITKNSLLPVSVGIYNFQGLMGQVTTHIMAAASIITMLPAIIVFFVLQKFIVGALTAGAVKG